MCDVKAECEKRVEKQDAFSVCENECSSSASLERHVGDGVDEIIESVSVNAELVEKTKRGILELLFSFVRVQVRRKVTLWRHSFRLDHDLIGVNGFCRRDD